ncbi:MAG: APC family permease [Actinobacteria bacterium]|nr:APC family permease [Actinomycetota bacterium]
MNTRPSFARRVRTLVLGAVRNPTDARLFRNLSLVALLAWVGLGGDALSSSSYGPEQAFLALQGHVYLGIFVAAATVLTVFVLSASYSQIIELFPSGGGGYLVASKLLSPTAGMLAGSALVIDYVLTIAVSIASGADALFSFLPNAWLIFKVPVAVAVLVVLTLANLRGIRESVVPLVPIFALFIVTHLTAVTVAIVANVNALPATYATATASLSAAHAELGLLGVILIVLRAYTLGAGTFTGIETVSNGMPILREPRVRTAKTTMRYIAVSLSVTVFGIMLAYLLYNVQPSAGKTLNAVLLEHVTAGWAQGWGQGFVLVTLISEAALLFVAAQAGYATGPRVLSNMALDGWAPTRFALLSDRLVTGNGVLLMSVAALLTLLATNGDVRFLVVLYSINVFITFFLSQLGMVVHWWRARGSVRHWERRLAVNGTGLMLTSMILVSVVVLQFGQGGWLTLFITGAVAGIAWTIRRRYLQSRRLVRQLDAEVLALGTAVPELPPAEHRTGHQRVGIDQEAPTAVVLVRGFNGLGLQTILEILRLFPATYRNFVFVTVGAIDAGVYRTQADIELLRRHVRSELDRYVDLMRRRGYHAEARSSLGIDVVEEIGRLAPDIAERFPRAVFFAGQALYPDGSVLDRWLHHQTAHSLEQRLTAQGVPFVTVPVRLAGTQPQISRTYQ